MATLDLPGANVGYDDQKIMLVLNKKLLLPFNVVLRRQYLIFKVRD